MISLKRCHPIKFQNDTINPPDENARLNLTKLCAHGRAVKLNSGFSDLRIFRMRVISSFLNWADNSGGSTFASLYQQVSFSDVSGGLACMGLDRHR